jgi:hypothetical protein
MTNRRLPRVAAAIAWSAFAVVATAGVVPAYEEVEVNEGGVVEGRVFLDGRVPPARVFHLIFSPNIEHCRSISDGKGNRLIKEFRVDREGGLEGVVVALVGVSKGKRFDYTPELRLKDCRIGPFVTPVRNAHPIVIRNDDPIAHDIQAYSMSDKHVFQMFNKPTVPESTALKKVQIRKGHYLFKTQCGVHDFMQSWGMAVGNPYFAVTSADGRFTMSDVPPGVYDVVAWHPHLKIQAQQVVVPPSGEVDLDFRFDSAEVNIPLHDLQTSYRLQTALQPRHLVPPSVELQTP